ncbi:related to MEAB protein [Cephalotrichum gorgonifer]|uniref:Related to MEAB protein n=1 Tax=Cephalotrichum gorgonifer TaxID=2041049 RepID=A0AAE8SUP4_9PEZI|nr:related to MEAB protein [Cephalotrichum gorgonifer]
MSIDQNLAPKEDSEESMGSSPEVEQMAAPSNNVPQGPQQPKRKGGRKPIYATSEERKQRNRQAQAAFRERRTEYIKQLEETIQIHEQNLHNLQTAHRNAADECLMLRYKNSLLERILLEKGIDVQAELCAKTASPNLGPTHMPQPLVQPPPIQRAIMNRHHQSRRSISSIAPKLEPGVSQMNTPTQTTGIMSPKSRPTPPSHANSPTSSGPTFGSQPALSPPVSDSVSLRTSGTPAAPKQHPLNSVPASPATSRAGSTVPHSATVRAAARNPPQAPNAQPVTTPTSTAGFYPTPSFQNHMEQLEQEYDAQGEMMDEPEIDASSGPGPYPAPYSGAQSMMSPATPGTGRPMASPQAIQTSGPAQYGTMTQLLDSSNLEWDPFGLSASMAFPAQFAFDQSNMR